MPYLSFKLIIPIVLLSVPAIADKAKSNGRDLILKAMMQFIILPAKDLKLIYHGALLNSRGLPNERDEGWMINHFLKTGIAIAGIDIGNPMATSTVERSTQHIIIFSLRKKEFNKKACLLAKTEAG